mgnify:CR=1 FL=1
MNFMMFLQKLMVKVEENDKILSTMNLINFKFFCISQEYGKKQKINSLIVKVQEENDKKSVNFEINKYGNISRIW